MFIVGRDSCYNFAMARKMPGEIKRAQTLTHYPLDGEVFARIRYGDECFGWRADTAPCHDCAVTKGQLHVPGCDVEECPNCRTHWSLVSATSGMPVRRIRIANFLVTPFELSRLRGGRYA